MQLHQMMLRADNYYFQRPETQKSLDHKDYMYQLPRSDRNRTDLVACAYRCVRFLSERGRPTATFVCTMAVEGVCYSIYGALGVISKYLLTQALAVMSVTPHNVHSIESSLLIKQYLKNCY